MKLDQIKYFLEVARTEHIGRAAKTLRLTPSTISQSVALLEEELGVLLFEKRGKGIGLTDKGHELIAHAEAIMARVEELKSDISMNSAPFSSYYRIGASHALSSIVIAPALAKIADAHTEGGGEFLSLRSHQVIESVLNRDIDFGFCFSPQENPKLSEKTLYNGQLVLCIGKSHPLFHERSRVMQKLRAYPGCLPKAFFGVEVCESHPMLEKHGLTSDIRFTYDSYDSAVSYLSSSHMWSLLPDFIAQHHKSALRMLPTPKGWRAPFRVSALWPKNRLMPPMLSELSGILRF